jgi:hypothetical protein
LTIALATTLSVDAACDNQCSGHGDCQIDDVCKCYDNWGVGLTLLSGDCSDRVCPSDIAWVDTPNEIGVFHRYTECSGKGLCDRKSGLCECFDGYEGKACQRTSCPNDCSGHGTCEYVEDIPFGTVYSQYTLGDDGAVHGTRQGLGIYPQALPYYGWDKTKIRGCVCDATYADIDCSKRLCPHGTDVLTVPQNLLIEDSKQVQMIRLKESEAIASFPNDDIDPDIRTFALNFRSRINETYSTIPIRFDVGFGSTGSLSDFANDVKLALLGLPNQVIDGVEVSVQADPSVSSAYFIRVTFTGDSVQGRQNLLSVNTIRCGDGCTPKITGLPLEETVKTFADPWFNVAWSTVNETVASDYNSYECGRRGKCDYSTGLCDCFEGYTGEACSEQTTLV